MTEGAEGQSELPPQKQNPLTEMFSFRQKFDGTQPEVIDGEKSAVAKVFESFVSDKMLNNIEQVNASSLWHALRLELAVDDKNRATIEITSGLGAKNLLFWLYPEGESPEHFIYKLDEENGIVTRADLGDFKTEISEEKVPSVDSEEYSQWLDKFQERQRNIVANIELERDMGVNHRPIGMSELDEVMKIVNKARVIPKDSPILSSQE